MVDKDFLLNRIMAKRPEISEILDVSFPVTSFGDLDKARVLTVGINPSSREFYRSGAKLEVLPVGQKRLVDAETLGVAPRANLSKEQAELVLQGNNSYFSESGNPYHWFNLLEQYVLEPIGCSYFDGSAAHVDLVQWATDPIWSNIESEKTREDLIFSDAEFLRQLFARGNWDLIIANGKQVYRTMREQRLFKLFQLEEPVISGTKRMFWNGKTLNSPLVTWSINLQQSYTGTEAREYCTSWLLRQMDFFQSDEYKDWFKSA